MKVARIAFFGHVWVKAQPNKIAGKGTTMKTKGVIAVAVFTVVLVAGFAALNPSLKMVAAVSAPGRNGELAISKNCTQYFAAGGAAGSFCTITSSNIPEIPAADTTRVYYDQVIGTPAGFLDSNVLLYVASGDWAVGRCTLDVAKGSGWCTFSDGVGPLAGFRARIDVSPIQGADFRWDGIYSFRPEGEL